MLGGEIGGSERWVHPSGSLGAGLSRGEVVAVEAGCVGS